LALSALAACQARSGEGESASVAASAVASAAASPTDASPEGSGGANAMAHHRPRFGRHVGLAAGLFRAATDLELPSAQRASVDRIEASLKADDASVRAAVKAFRTDLSSGVRAGKLDVAKLASDDALVDKAIDEHRQIESTDLKVLHDALEPSQRAAVVAAVRAKQAERESHLHNWIEGKEGDAGETEGGTVDWTKRRLDRLTSELDLDPVQQKQASAVLAKAQSLPNAAGMRSRWEDRKRRGDAVLDAFASDLFDPKAFDLTVLPGKAAHDVMDRMVEFFSQLLPILHPDQRDKFAMTLERPLGGGRPPGFPGTGRGGPLGARGPADDIAFPFVEPGEGPPADESSGPSR
jgi:Spy/CpxP family protein refolding chaperone